MGIATQRQQQAIAGLAVGNHHALANERAHLDDHLPPGLAPLPPAVVAGVVAKAHEDRQGNTQQGEGCGVDLGEERRMQVLHQYDQRCQGGDHHAAPGNAFGDRAFEGNQDVEQVGFGMDDHRASRQSCS
ncbi:hypothetical protein D3C76_1506300 [compost metagenome]